MKKLFFLLFSIFAFSSYAQSAEEILKSMSGKKPPIKNEYNFSSTMTYAINTKSGKTANFKYLLPASGEEAFGIEMSAAANAKTKSVIDTKNKAMIMFMEAQKMAMVIPMDMGKINSEAQKNPSVRMNPPVKTGKTKVILGYTCNEWVSENQDYKSSMWICENINLPSQGFSDIMKSSLQKGGNFSIPSGLSGFPLEIDTTDKRSKETSSMTCVEINKNAALKLTTAGYKIM